MSTFDWSVVPATVTIHIRQDSETYATRGEIWLDAHLLDSGSFGWGPIQHEYGHQVDFFLLDDAERAQLNALLHGSLWSHDESAAMAPAAFRQLLQRLLGVRNPAPPVVTVG